MSAFDELMREAEAARIRYENRKPWEILGDKILSSVDPKEIIALQEEIDSFMDSDASEGDKERLNSYLECYYMKLDAVLPGGVLASGIFDIVDEAEIVK